MKLLITGGAGYIGSMIANMALEHGHKVMVADMLWFDKKIPILYKDNPNYEFRNVDITREKAMEGLIEGADYVIHAAAIVGDPAGRKFPRLTQKVNYDASVRLIERSRARGIKGFIFLSTCSNYGKSEGLAAEESELCPLSLYAETKVGVERYLMDISGMDWVICRLSTVYGLSPRMRFDLTINDFAANGYIDRMLDIYLPYTYRPYVHVFDVARVIARIVEDFGRVKNNIFNVGFEGENYQKIRIAEIVKKFVPGMEIRIGPEGPDARDYKVDFSKLKRSLGVGKTHDVEYGVREVIDTLSSGAIRDHKDPVYYNTSMDYKEAAT